MGAVLFVLSKRWRGESAFLFLCGRRLATLAMTKWQLRGQGGFDGRVYRVNTYSMPNNNVGMAMTVVFNFGNSARLQRLIATRSFDLLQGMSHDASSQLYNFPA